MNQATFNYVPDDSEKKTEAVRPETPAAEQASPEKETGSDVALIEIKQSEVVALFSNEKGLDPVIEKIRKRVETEVFDVTTEEGRARIGSVARQIGSAKMDLKRMGQALTEDWRLKTKAVTSETSRMEKELDSLRDKILAPRIEFDNREKQRVDGHKSRLSVLEALSVFMDGEPSSADVQSRIDALSRDFKDIQWEEFSESAKAATEKVTAALSDRLAKTKKYEAEQEELARLRKAQAEREQKERDDAIAKEAAEKARIEAEEKARKEKEALQREKDEADAKLKKAEADRVSAHQQAVFKMAELAKVPEQHTSAMLQSRLETIKIIYDERDWQEFKGSADEIWQVASKNLTSLHAIAVLNEAEAKKAADRAAADKAAQAERDRIAEEQRKQKEADDARAADQAHKAKINNAVLAKLVQLLDNDNSTEDVAKAIITAIAKGEIPNVTIKY